MLQHYENSLNAAKCEFNELESEMIRDQIVEKCYSKKLKERLLQQDTLDLNKAVRIAKTMESAEQEVQLMTGTKENPIILNCLDSTGGKGKHYEAKKDFSCFRCGGKDGHTADKCGAISLNCRKFGKAGHLARVCRSNSSDQRRSSSEKPRGNKKHQKSRKIRAITSKNWLQESTSEEDDFEPVQRLNSKDGSVQVAINRQKVRMVVDTGSKQNIISSRLYKALFRDCELKPTKKKFIAYGQQTPLNCLGCFQASMQSGISNYVNARIYVIEGEAESLLRRELSSFSLEIIKQIKVESNDSSNNAKKDTCSSEKCKKESIESLLHEFSDIFQGVGKVTDYEHTIQLDPEVVPVSQKLRRFPLSQIEAVNNEIDKMLEADIIEEAPVSPWVSNIVVVPKQNGDIRVCCDYREVNKAIIRERYIL